MTTTPDHKPEPWFWEAGSEHCPHGPEPEDDTTAEWDEWSSRHTASDQTDWVCLDAPMGDHCPVCSYDHNDPVPWSACTGRERSRPKPDAVPNPDAGHQPVTVFVGTVECLDRECDEYFTEGGDEDPGVERCSHIREEQACSCQRGPDGEYGSEPCALTPAA